MLIGIVLSAAVGAVAAWCAWRVGRWNQRWPAASSPMVVPAAAAVFSLFVVTLSFLVVATTSALAEARRATYDEAGALQRTHTCTYVLSGKDQQTVRSRLAAYLHQVVAWEWPQMEAGRVPTQGAEDLDVIREVIGSPLQDPSTSMLRGDCMKTVADAYQARDRRISYTTVSVPPVLLVTLAAAVLAALVFSVLAGWPPGRRFAMALGLLATLMCFTLWLVFQLDHVYTGLVHVEPTAYDELHRRLGTP